MDSQKIEKSPTLLACLFEKWSEVWQWLDYSEQENSDTLFFWHVQSFDRSERQQPSEKQYFPYNETLNFCSSCVEHIYVVFTVSVKT